MRRVILAIVGTAAALVMLLSFKTHSVTSQAAQPPTVASSTPSAATSSGTAAAPSSAAPTTTSTTKAQSTSTKTVTGDAADTRYGPVQVKITVTNGKVTAVDAIEYPQNDPKDAQINSYAIPQLDQEVLAAGNASIDMVSGATFTSQGYLTSLQSALNKAGV